MIEATPPQAAVDQPPRVRGRLGGHLVRVRTLDWSWVLLTLLLVVALGCRLLWLDKPDGQLIFDEEYYVNAARVILGWPVAPDAPYATAPAGFDPNTEHPPAAKLLIAASMWLVGDNALGWRLASVAFGMLSILLLYGVVRQLGAPPRVARLAAFVYAFDNLVLVHSRIATLDIFVVSFLLLGVYAYLAGKPTVAGLACVAATLCKLTGVYSLVALVAFEGLRLLRRWLEQTGVNRAQLQRLLWTIVVYLVALPVVLGGLDHFWSSSYNNPIAHLDHMVAYGLALTRPEGPQGEESSPWQWLVNDVPMTYLRVDEQVRAQDELQSARALIFFRGAMNPYVIFIAPLAIAYAGYAAWTRRDDGAVLVLSLFSMTYGPFWPAALLAHRISYLFYFLPTLPAVAIGASHFLYAPQTPRIVRWAYIGAVLLGFSVYFPFRTVP